MLRLSLDTSAVSGVEKSGSAAVSHLLNKAGSAELTVSVSQYDPQYRVTEETDLELGKTFRLLPSPIDLSYIMMIITLLVVLFVMCQAYTNNVDLLSESTLVKSLKFKLVEELAISPISLTMFNYEEGYFAEHKYYSSTLYPYRKL